MNDFHASPFTWPFWRASILVTIIGGVLGALLALVAA